MQIEVPRRIFYEKNSVDTFDDKSGSSQFWKEKKCVR
jgi:hypothetical protein